MDNFNFDSRISELGVLSLAFVNTVDMHASEYPEESLFAYPDLVDWALKKGIISKEEQGLLVAKAAAEPERANIVYKNALTFREALYRIFTSRFNKQPSKPSDLGILNEMIISTLPHLRIATYDLDYRWELAEGEVNLDMILWYVTLAAVRLLTSPELAYVKVCADETGCGWLFLDTSKNHTRRWCDMKDCGNRAKARRHYQRKQQIKA